MAHADTLAKGIEVSVLTCSPGQEVYSLYGHTAIRVRDGRTGEDEVFNYGIFDFNTEHFVWKFVLGETDYICASVPWNYFIREYEKRGSSVAVQVLNLTQAEAVRVKEYLYRNVQPENRVYRYNFLTNNCTTKVMDCVEACVEGDIVYSWTQEPYTYRTILHKYTEAYPWEQEGNDFLLGADVDTVLSHRATCFIPDFYKNALDGAVVRGEFEDTRKLVTSTQVWRASDNTVAKSAEELLELAKANGVEMTADEAAAYFAQLNPKSGELDDDELDAVAGGGCDQSSDDGGDDDYEDKNKWLIFSKL